MVRFACVLAFFDPAHAAESVFPGWWGPGRNKLARRIFDLLDADGELRVDAPGAEDLEEDGDVMAVSCHAHGFPVRVE